MGSPRVVICYEKSIILRCYRYTYTETHVPGEIRGSRSIGSKPDGIKTFISCGILKKRNWNNSDMAWEDERGYIKVYKDGEERYQHRVVAEEKLGRELNSDEVVHHKNGDKSDNRWENLNVVHVQDHQRIHSGVDVSGEENMTTVERLKMWLEKDPEMSDEKLSDKVDLDVSTVQSWRSIIS